MGDHLAGHNLVLILELGTHVSKVVVKLLSFALRGFFSRFSGLHNIETAELHARDQKVAGSIPVWGSETFFWICDKA